MIVMRRLGGAIQCPVEGESKPLSEGNRYIRSSRLSPISRSAEPSFCKIPKLTIQSVLILSFAQLIALTCGLRNECSARFDISDST